MRRVAVVLLALFLPLVACGDDGDDGGGGGEAAGTAPVQLLAAAPGATADAGTARLAMRVDGNGGAAPFAFEADGVVDFDTGTVAMELDMTEAMAAAGAPEGFDGRMQFLIDGTTMYLRSPLFAQGMPGIDADTWLRMDLEAIAAEQGVDLSQVLQGANNDPRQGLAFLHGVTEGGIEELGTEEVRGTTTTRYRAEVDLRRAMEEAEGLVDESQLQAYVDQLGETTVVLDVWLDDEERVRRITMPFPVPEDAATGTDGGEVVMTIEYFDFGAEVDVEPPAQSVDLFELLGEGMLGGMEQDEIG